MLRRTAALAAALSMFTGCGAWSQENLLLRLSASKTGCPREVVKVSDVQREGTRPRTWTVSCDQQAWRCRNEWGRVTCTPIGSGLDAPVATRP